MEHDHSAGRCPGFVTALVHRCGQGDQAALLALMELLYVPVRARIAGARDDDEVDELVGRAFVRIWERAPSYVPARQGNVVSWLLDEAASTVPDASRVLVAS